MPRLSYGEIKKQIEWNLPWLQQTINEAMWTLAGMGDNSASIRSLIKSRHPWKYIFFVLTVEQLQQSGVCERESIKNQQNAMWLHVKRRPALISLTVRVLTWIFTSSCFDQCSDWYRKYELIKASKFSSFFSSLFLSPNRLNKSPTVQSWNALTFPIEMLEEGKPYWLLAMDINCKSNYVNDKP